MWKFYLIAIFAFSGCTHFTFNASMCDQIASDPHATIPAECRNYNEKEAQKAFDNLNNKTETTDKEIIEFNQKDKEKEE